MSKLENGLKEWVALGLVSADQAKRIKDYEAAKPESSWILSGMLILGALIVGIGVISLIAANWYQIPDSIKLAGDFILLSVIAYATFYSWESKKIIQFEVLLLFFLILCLASIGLISQIYHTGGKFYQALMLWSVITFAATLTARHVFVPFVWTGAFLAGIVSTAAESLAFQPFFNNNYHAIQMSVPLLCATLTVACRSLAGEIGSTRAFRSWILIGGLGALVTAEVSGASKFKDFTFGSAYMPGYIFAIIAAIGIVLSLEYRNIQKTFLLIAIALFLAIFHLPFLEIKTSIVYAIFTIAILGLMAVFLASLKERRLFQLFLFFIGMRFLAIYFEALGGLATTGLGLIISGGLVIMMAILWNKYRTSIAVWAERWMQ